MLVAAAAILGVVAAPAVVTSSATHDGIELTWTAPAEICPDAAAVVADSVRVLGPVAAPHGPLRALASVHPDAEGFALELAIDRGDGDGGTRRLHGRTCPALARVAALVIAVAIDPDAMSRAEDAPASDPLAPPPAEPIVPAPAPTSAAAQPTPHQAPAARERPTTIDAPVARTAPPWLGLLVAAGIGALALPKLAGVADVAIAIGQRRWRAEAGVIGWTPSERRSTTNPAVGGRFGLLAGRLRGCYVARIAPLELPVCGGIEIGAALARGVGELTPRRRPSAAFVAGTVGPQLWWRPTRLRGRLGVFARADLLLVAVQPRFATAPSGVIWRMPTTAVEVVAGAEVRFGRSR